MRALAKASSCLALVLICALSSTPSNAMTGMAFKLKCENDPAFCLSFLDGFGAGAALAGSMTEALRIKGETSLRASDVLSYCMPDKGVTNEQVRLIYLKWANNNPALLHEPVWMPLALAMSRAFPCP